MDGVFELNDYHDLMAKLERDYEALSANPRSSDLAFNFFVTAWHLLDWLYPGRGNRQKRQGICDGSNLLRICEKIAVGAKHYTVENHKVAKVGRTYRDRELSRRLLADGLPHLAIMTDRLMIDLDPDSAAEFGRGSIPASGLAAMVVDYWKHHLDEYDGPS